MTVNQQNRRMDLLEESKHSELAVLVESSSGRKRQCDSCGGLEVTVLLGGADRPQIRWRPGSKRLGYFLLYEEGGGKSGHMPPRREVCGATQGTVFGSPRITIICGECGASLMRFEGGAGD
jgi:ribosomal protein S27E